MQYKHALPFLKLTQFLLNIFVGLAMENNSSEIYGEYSVLPAQDCIKLHVLKVQYEDLKISLYVRVHIKITP